MNEQPELRGPKQVTLVAHRGETSVFIDAEIDTKGSLVTSGQDVGKAPMDCFGDSDYEYWLVVADSDKDRVLSLLVSSDAAGLSEDEKDWALLRAIEKAYAGDMRVVSVLCCLLRANGIPYEFSTY